MATLTVFLYALVVVVALLLIGIIMIQPSKSGGMGAAFGGIGESVFGGQAGSHLTKATVVMTAVFFVLTLILASLIGHGVSVNAVDTGVRAQLEEAAEKAVPAAPEGSSEAVPAAPASKDGKAEAAPVQK